MAGSKDVVEIDGHRLTLTNLDKVLYPETGTTKADLIGYYAAVAPFLIPLAAGRPVTRKRWVNGVGTAEDPGSVFFEKNLAEHAPGWVKRQTIVHSDHTNVYPLVNDLATLTWLAQNAALELHVPQWRFGRDGSQLNPDRLVLDLDPGEGAGLPECVEAAKLARRILTDMGLDPLPVTSGSKGIHLYAALDGSQTSQQVSDVAHELARGLEADHKDLIVSDMKKSLRHGKVLVDWSQNSAAKTTIVPYSLRGRLRPTVAAPRTWRELSSPALAQLDYRQVMQRVRERPDPLAALSAGGRDRLAVYRGKRDAARTPEPVPSGFGAAPPGRSFVIQRHDARRLHYDFRLEHEGVLVSWALPKGVPTDPGQNHLAVQTEDHPLEYGSFEGTIPQGEYGGGDVVIWDSGEYELEKWRDGKEVIATLHGEPGGGLVGPRRFALIHTGGEGKAAANWLVHLMKPETTAAASPEGPAKGSPKSAPERRKRAGLTPDTAKPMLATLGTERSIDRSRDWAYEMKWDGIRALAFLPDAGAPVRLLSRNGIDQGATYPELMAALPEQVRGPAVLDGEIVALNKQGRPDFGLLQSRMGLTKPGDVKRAMAAAPVQFMAFDLLATGGESLLEEDYEDRRQALERTVHGSGPVKVPPAFDGDFEAAFTSSRELGLEGIVAKRRGSAYRPGRRSPAWVKIKHHSTQEVVIGGWKPGAGRRSGLIGSLVLGIPENGRLRYVGRVGTGFREDELAAMTAKLRALERKTAPFEDVPKADAKGVRWVTPKLVGEVEFAEWTGGGRLRQPSWRGWRPDKAPADVVPEP